MRLAVLQSMWGMDGLADGSRPEWTLEQKVSEIHAAGFDGAGVFFTTDLPLAVRSAELLHERGLLHVANCYPESVEEFRRLLDVIAATGPVEVNLQPNIRPMTVLEGVPYVLGCLAAADDAGVRLLFETHRDRLTTDLLFTIQLIDAVPAMRLTADLSHYLLGREFRWPISDENHRLIGAILERSDAFHGRVASREQIQVQISFAHHRPWLELFLGWWEKGLRLWRQRASADELVTFTVELGPANWYAMTDADGRELSDRWEEALMLQGLVRELWAGLEAGVADSADARP